MIDLLKIGNLEIKNGIIQGGMGVRISCASLASAVANCGGAGIIASVGLGESRLEGVNYPGGYNAANADALREEIRDARKMSTKKGVIGVNIMHALSDYPSLVETAVEEDIDLIICGAGIPKDLPKYLNGKDIKLLPIVSSARYSNLICEAWKRNGHLPDAIIVEGPKAGGHLAYTKEQLDNPEYVENALETIVKDVVEESKQFGQIPVIAAGGIYTGADIRKAHGWGAAGVQMATRFVPTLECDASDAFKWAYLNATEDDMQIILSPVGLPGRAIKSPFLERVMNGEKIEFRCDYKCLKTCKPQESPYCIANALIEAQKGNLKKGFAFAGTNAVKCTRDSCLDKSGKFITVKTLMQRLSDEYHASK